MGYRHFVGEREEISRNITERKREGMIIVEEVDEGFLDDFFYGAVVQFRNYRPSRAIIREAVVALSQGDVGGFQARLDVKNGLQRIPNKEFRWNSNLPLSAETRSSIAFELGFPPQILRMLLTAWHNSLKVTLFFEAEVAPLYGRSCFPYVRVLMQLADMGCDSVLVAQGFANAHGVSDAKPLKEAFGANLLSLPPRDLARSIEAFALRKRG